MKRFLGWSLVAAALFATFVDTAEARFGRRRYRSNNCCTSTCQNGCAQNGCAPQGMAYHNQDPNAAPPGTIPPPAPQPNTTFYRGNPNQPLDNPGQPRPAPAPQVQGRTNLQGTVDQNGIRAKTNVQGSADLDD